MLGVTDYGALVAAVILFLFVPGPGKLALITSTGKGGIQADHFWGGGQAEVVLHEEALKQSREVTESNA